VILERLYELTMKMSPKIFHHPPFALENCICDVKKKTGKCDYICDVKKKTGKCDYICDVKKKTEM
jgi:hypothetical protein